MDSDKCSKVDLPACSKYQFFKSTIWCKGFHCSYGQYRDFDPVDRSYTEYPVLRVKFNPNKYADSAVFDPLFSWINSRCVDGTLVKFDYAVDVPCRLEDLVVQSRKEPGLFKGTRYYGQRNQHGRVKIYDKGKESAFRDDSDLDVSDDPITRIEYTFCAGRPLSFDVILWLTRGPEPLPDVSVLGSQSYALARLLRDLRACGGDVSLGLSYLMQELAKLEPYTIGSGIQLFDSGARLVVDLLGVLCSWLNIAYCSGGVNPVAIGVSSLPDWVRSADLCDPASDPDNFDDYDYADELPI